jgi:pimeloyl-ACP methyl ester carboxylesterase
MHQAYPTMIRDPSLADAYARQAIASDPGVSGRLFEEVMVADLRPRLKAITGPVTVVYVGSAKMDPLYRAAYASLPQARLEHIDDSRHYVMLDQPEKFAAEVRTFLSGAH